MAKNLLPQDCVNLVKDYFSANFPDFNVEKSGAYTGWWWLSFSNRKSSVQVDFEGDYGGYFFVYLWIDYIKYDLWKFDKTETIKTMSNTKNLMYQLKLLKTIL